MREGGREGGREGVREGGGIKVEILIVMLSAVEGEGKNSIKKDTMQV